MNTNKLLLLLLLLFSCALNAQENTDGSSDIFLGVKGGVNFPSLHYGNSDLNKYKTELESKFLLGIFVELPLNDSRTISLRPEINFITRGQHINEKDVKYSMEVNYTDIYLPFIYSFRADRERSFAPYLLIAPTIGFATGGEIKLNGLKTDVSDANVNPINIGAYGGAGIKMPVYNNNEKIASVGVEAGYYLGLNDSYSSKERNGEATALNLRYYEIDKTRKHRGLQVQVTVGVPLNVFRKKKATPVVKTVIPKFTEVPVIKEEPKEQPQKECYSLEEIQELITDKKEITGKKICAIQQITFDFGNANLKSDSRFYLDQIVLLMRNNNTIKIKVNGHTDNVGNAEYNMFLSKSRAQSVYNYLIQNGITEDMLSYDYFGMTKPIADNSTEEGRQINRRVEFEITNQ